MEFFAVWTSSVSDNRCWEETHPIANLVLDDCFERVFCDNYYTENQLGLHVVQGNTVSMVSDIVDVCILGKKQEGPLDNCPIQGMTCLSNEEFIEYVNLSDEEKRRSVTECDERISRAEWRCGFSLCYQCRLFSKTISYVTFDVETNNPSQPILYSQFYCSFIPYAILTDRT